VARLSSFCQESGPPRGNRGCYGIDAVHSTAGQRALAVGIALGRPSLTVVVDGEQSRVIRFENIGPGNVTSKVAPVLHVAGESSVRYSIQHLHNPALIRRALNTAWNIAPRSTVASAGTIKAPATSSCLVGVAGRLHVNRPDATAAPSRQRSSLRSRPVGGGLR
jgi:hypothetical protein